ncbi:MAG: tetratricopeptide repeat protein [Bacteroidales bacterium]|nr:tetratricopeptide repeat protein [Bacteroidales bacterium]
MAVWTAEIKEIEKLYESIRGRLPELEKELSQLTEAEDENVIMLYSRRCLEIMISDLCERELNRPRKTDPLKGIIDKLNKEEKVPSNIIVSMHGLNDLSTFGVHPKDFDPRQVKPVLNNLSTILDWYLIYRGIITSEIKEQWEAVEKEKRKKKKRTKRALWLGSITINIIFILVLIVSLKPVPFSEEDWTLITDFENNTGDEVFDQSLNTALEVSIQQSSFVNVLPRTRISETLVRMGKEKDEVISEDTGIEIAQREGIGIIVVCNISLVGDTYLLTSKVVEVNTRKTLKTESFQANGKNEVLTSLDKLAREIRRNLGESLREVNHEIIPLPEATTSSLEALKYLSKGLDAWNTDGQYEEAIALFLKAIELDPEFALAYASLGSLYYWLNNRMKGEENFSRALKLSGRLTEKERLWIEARVEEYRGNYDGAILKYNIYLRNYPGNSGAWFSLGYCYMMLDRPDEAIVAFNKSSDIHKDEDPNIYINIATCYSFLNKHQEAIDYYLKSFALNPKLLLVSNLNHEFGISYIQLGDFDKAKEVFEKMLKGEDDRKARGYRSLALLSMYRGKFSEAIDQLHESILINKTLRIALSELRDRLFLASIYKTIRMMLEYNGELNKASILLRAEGMQAWWFILYGKFRIRDGKIQDAEKTLEEISARANAGNKADEAAINLLKGEIELARGDTAEAHDLIKTAVRLRRDAYTLESLAYYYNKTGNPEKAISTYTDLIKITSIGWEGQECWIMAHYNLGKLYEAKGDNQQAIKYYQSFINIWKDADEGIPDLIDAKARLKKLQEQQS